MMGGTIPVPVTASLMPLRESTKIQRMLVELKKSSVIRNFLSPVQIAENVPSRLNPIDGALNSG